MVSARCVFNSFDKPLTMIEVKKLSLSLELSYFRASPPNNDFLVKSNSSSVMPFSTKRFNSLNTSFMAESVALVLTPALTVNKPGKPIPLELKPERMP